MDVFVGRGAELATLRELRAAASHCPARLAIVVGEAGVGKTSLVGRAADEARAGGAPVAWGRCFDSDGGASFGPWREAFADARPASAALPPAEQRAGAFDAVTQALLGLPAGAVVVLEDLHWADDDSLHLLRHVGRFVARGRWLLIVTVRDPDVDAARRPLLDDVLADLGRDAGGTRLALRRFSRDELDAYAVATVGQRLPQAIAATIHEDTAGNPLFVREVLRHLVEEEALVTRDGRLASNLSLGELRAPDGVRQVVRRRARRLGAAARTLIEVAALLGEPAPVAVLACGAAMTSDAAVDALDEAIAAGFLRAGAGRRYDFSHAVVARALRDELGAGRVRRHRDLARALAALCDRGDLDDPGAVAAQFHAARELDGADAGLRFALVAAERASAAGASGRAVELLERARDLAARADAGARGDVLARLALAQATALRGADAATTVAAAVATLRGAGVAEPALAVVVGGVARELKLGGTPRPVWEPLAAQALAMAGAGGDLAWARLRVLVDAYQPLVAGALNVGRWLGLDPAAVAILRAHGDEDDVAATVDPHAWRDRDETEALIGRARGWRSASATLRVLEACARDRFFRQGDVAGTIVLMEEVDALAARVGSLRAQAIAATVLACAHGVMGRLDLGRAAQARAAELGQRLGAMHRMNLVGPMAIRCVLGYVSGDGDWPAIVADLLRFVGQPEAARTPFGIVAAGLATFASAQGDDRAATRRYAELLVDVVVRAPPTMVEHGAARDNAGLAVWELGAADLAARLAPVVTDRAACAIGGAAPFGCAELTAARIVSLGGDHAGAASWFAEARAVLAGRGLAPVVAIAALDEARAALAAGDRERAAARLADADAGFDRLGLAPWRARVAALQAGMAAAPSARPAGLTEREVEVLALLAAGLANKEIAARLFISVPTVERHIANVYEKTGARGRAAATAYAIRHQLR